ncbi:DUF2080 family transposase-associated protein [Methanoplanus sp. FWC-SCC4]|uniref:DUF2080 family transposase-associated protein n=1 Tax=Methanochimaera problematica TaxID=2609417 RepID=A0AA97FEJ3_9EURY|nr:DUF2080 family transposase-associated protein [Methanoplanus sp. FWC-SCC4]WOF16774.1 DUF2080 family transposase-associated protein [Methanoplanus sp. FWC-SCC4]
MDKIEITVSGYEVREKTATKSGNSCHVLLPQDWIGKRVKIILLDPVEDKKE